MHKVELQLPVKPPRGRLAIEEFCEAVEEMWRQHNFRRLTKGNIELSMIWTSLQRYHDKIVQRTWSLILWKKIAYRLWSRGNIIDKEWTFECTGAVQRYGEEPHVKLTFIRR